MARIDDPGGGGSTQICNVSPSDQAGQINNILTRLTNLEIAVAKLAGLDVTATNASDLVQSLGMITNGTIIMPDNSLTGWTNSIPPGNFTGSILSNGILTTWDNGVVSYQVDSAGVSVGGGGSVSWAQVSILASGSSITTISELTDADGIVSVSSPTITIATSGIYLFSMRDNISANISTSGTTTLLQVYDAAFGLDGQSVVCEGSAIYPTTGGSTRDVYVGNCLVTNIPSNSYDLTATVSSTGGTWTHTATVSILKLA